MKYLCLLSLFAAASLAAPSPIGESAILVRHPALPSLRRVLPPKKSTPLLTPQTQGKRECIRTCSLYKVSIAKKLTVLKSMPEVLRWRKRVYQLRSFEGKVPRPQGEADDVEVWSPLELLWS